MSLSCLQFFVFFLELVTVALPSSTSRVGAGYGVRAGVDQGGLKGVAATRAHLATIW